jgi:inorganic pyrophosphatase
VGSIFKAKVLGCFCLIDQDEIDWKVLLVDAQ